MLLRDRRLAMGVETSPGYVAQRFRLDRRPRRGDAGFTTVRSVAFATKRAVSSAAWRP